MGLPKLSLCHQTTLPDFVQPQSIFDLMNFCVSELMGVSGSLVTRICENEYGITREAWQFIAMLAQLGPMSPSNLASKTTIDRSQTSKTLRGLIQQNLLLRKTVAGDGRRASVSLTAQGKALYDDLFPRVVQVHHQVLADLNDAERQTLAKALTMMQGRALNVALQHQPDVRRSRRSGGRRVF